MPNVLGVAATAPKDCWALDPTTDLDWPAPYTDFGQRVIDLAAPGGKIMGPLRNWSRWKGSRYPACVFDMVLSTSTCFGPRDVGSRSKGPGTSPAGRASPPRTWRAWRPW